MRVITFRRTMRMNFVNTLRELYGEPIPETIELKTSSLINAANYE